MIISLAANAWLALFSTQAVSCGEAINLEGLSPRKSAELYYLQGKRCVDAFDFSAALDAFEAAWNLAPRPVVMLARAQCEEKLGRPDRALLHFGEAIELSRTSTGDRLEEKDITASNSSIEALRRALVPVVFESVEEFRPYKVQIDDRMVISTDVFGRTKDCPHLAAAEPRSPLEGLRERFCVLLKAGKHQVVFFLPQWDAHAELEVRERMVFRVDPRTWNGRLLVRNIPSPSLMNLANGEKSILMDDHFVTRPLMRNEQSPTAMLFAFFGLAAPKEVSVVDYRESSSLAPGEYTLSLHGTYIEDYQRALKIRGGEEVDLSINYQEAPFYETAAFWIPMGFLASVGGAVAIGLAIGASSDPEREERDVRVELR